MVQEMQAVRVSRIVNVAPKTAYQMFLTDVAFREWLSNGAYVQPRDNGKILLTWDAGFAAIGQYQTRQTDQQVVFTWQVVGEQEVSTITVDFEDTDGGTLVTLTHDGSSVGPNGREPHDGWEAALEVLQAVAERGDDIRFSRRPMLGILLGEMNEEVAARLGLDKTQGIRISGTLENMGARAAGLEADDVILKVDRHDTLDGAGLFAAVGNHIAGDTVEVQYWRNGALHTTNLTFSKREIPEVPATASGLADALQTQYDALNAELDEILAGVTEEEADYHPGENEWNVKDVLAHISFGDRDTQFWLTTLNSNDETIAEAHNIPARIKAFAALNPTLADTLNTMRRTQAEFVAYLRNLSDEFVAHTPTYKRFGQAVLSGALHPRMHFDQIRAAIEAARTH